MIQRHTLSIVGSLVLAVGTTHAQNAFLLDLYNNTPTVVASSIMSTGERLFLVNTDAGKVLWKGSSTGDPIWAKEMPGSPWESTFVPQLNGVVHTISARSTMTANQLPIMWDTLVEFVSINALNSDGTLQWARELELVQQVPYESYLVLDKLNAMQLLNGGLLVSLHLSGSTYPDMLHVFTFDQSGDLVSARTYGEELWPGVPIGLVPGNNYDLEDLEWMLTSDGRTYLGSKTTPTNAIKLFGFDADGNMDFAKKYRYINGLANYSKSMTAQPIGELVLGFSGLVASTPTVITLRLSGTGEVIDRDLYQGMPVAMTLKMTSSPNNDLLLVPQTGQNPHVIRTDHDGTIVAAWHAPDFSTPPFDYGVSVSSAAASTDQANINVQIHRQQQVFGYNDYFAAGITVSTADPGCLFEPVQISHYDVADSLVVVDTMQLAFSFPLSPVVTVGPGLADANIMPTVDLCSQVVGADELAIVGMRLINSVGREGVPIALVTQQPMRLQLIAASGSVTVRPTAILSVGRNILPVDGLASGLYILRAFDLNGVHVASAKVLVE